MRTCKAQITGFLAAFLIVPMTGCGKETVNIPDTTPPRVLSTTPAQSATGVASNTTISAIFSKPMNAGKVISAHSFLLAGPGGLVVTGQR